MEKQNVLKAIEELRKNKERKFKQSVDLIINLKNFDIKKESVNLFVELPYPLGEKKVAAFLNNKSELIDTITKNDFPRYKTKQQIKNLVKSYDFFLAGASLMPSLAATFGRYLGPAGKMPSPQMGVLRQENEQEIKEVMSKINKVTRVKSKEPSLKFSIGKENMKDEEIAENVLKAYNTVLNALSKKNENIKNVMIKFTMTKPVKIAQ